MSSMLKSQEPSMYSKILMVVFDTHPNHTKMQKFDTQVGNQMSRTIMRLVMTQVLHFSSQEPSMSSKSLMMGGGVFLTHF